PRWRLQVEHNRFLVAVVVPEEQRVFESRLVREEWADEARRIAFGRLDLDDFGAKAGQEQPGIFGALVGDLDDAEPGQHARPGIPHHLAWSARHPRLRCQDVLPSNGSERIIPLEPWRSSRGRRQWTMLVRRGEHTDLEARAKAEPAADVLTRDYYTLRPPIRLTAEPADQPRQPETATEITLDGNDVARLVECAIRHPTPNMRYAVLEAIWNHPDSFRQIFQFGLNAPPGFPEIRKIVAEALDKAAAAADSAASKRAKPAGDTLLPRMPLPAHLKGKGRTR